MTTAPVVTFMVVSAALFAAAYFPAVNQLTRSVVTPYPKANVRRRILAATVDGLLVITPWLIYRNSASILSVAAGAAYLLLRDGIGGRSIGKIFCGLVVIDVATGLPCSLPGSVRRNALLLVPGANAVAVVLEAFTLLRDPQGQRLGDRIAQTQVVDGLAMKDFAAGFERWWLSFIAELHGVRRPTRDAVKVDQ